jgi:hypothetical protein
MTRSVLAALFAIACASCVSPPTGPDLWSLSVSDANNNEIYLGGHYTLEDCRKAGVDWFSETREHNYVLQCRLNCRKLTPDEPATCEATQPVG